MMKIPNLILLTYLVSQHPAHSSITIGAVPDSVRVNPQTGRIYENSDVYPANDRWQSGYRDENSVWRKDRDRNKVFLWGARNEYVSAQIILARNDSDLSEMIIEISELKGPAVIPCAKNISLFKEWYVKVDRPSEAYIRSLGLGWYPEILIPYNEEESGKHGMPFSLPDAQNKIPGQQNQAFWLDVFVPKTIPAGLYQGTITIQGKAGDTFFHHAVPLELQVMDFTLPDDYHFIPSLNTYGQPFRDASRTMEYFQTAHRHRCLCESFNPKPPFQGRGEQVKIDWMAYDETLSPFLDGTAFTSKYNYYGPGTGRPIARIYLPFTNNQSWVGKAVPLGDSDHESTYQEVLRQIERHFDEKGWNQTVLVFFINDFDETKTQEGHGWIEYYGKLLWSAGLKNPSRFRYRFDSGALRNISEHIPEWTSEILIHKLDEVNLWVVCGAEKYISANEAAALRRQGKDVWFYFSNTSGEPCIGSCYIDAELIGLRTWPWIGMRYGLTSACIWEWTYGASIVKRWTDPWTGEAGARGNGDACLIYDGSFAGIQRMCPSIRLKSLRRGVQDYEYLWILANEFHRSKTVEEIVRQIIPAALDQAGAQPPGKWKHDPESWEKARQQIASEIMKCQSKAMQ
ncbi:MAG: hypothetical protein ACE15F_04930 [bacterium]